jgi:hypothetical protein
MAPLQTSPNYHFQPVFPLAADPRMGHKYQVMDLYQKKVE